MLIHTGGNFQRRPKSKSTLPRDTTSSSSNDTRSKASLLNNSKILSNNNNTEFDNQDTIKRTVFKQSHNVAVAASPKTVPIFQGDNNPPQGVMTPVSIRTSRSEVFPDCFGDEPMQGNPCYRCYGGKYFHISETLENDDPRRGCVEWFPEEVPLNDGTIAIQCSQRDLVPAGGCEICQFGTLINNCDAECNQCVDGICVNLCPDNQVCIEGVCLEICNVTAIDNNRPCEAKDCNHCVTKQVQIGTDNITTYDVCEHRCANGEICNGNGKCIGNCWPPCGACEHCIERNGVYGCEAQGKQDCAVTTVCCNDEIIQYATNCETIDSSCNVVSVCGPDEECATYFAGKSEFDIRIGCKSCAKKCNSNSDCDSNNCQSCSITDGVCQDDCGYGYFCNGDGTCSKLQCTGCQELRAKPCGTKPFNNIDCWECVDICDEISVPGLPLTCITRGNGKFSCEYVQAEVASINLIP